jgi:pimeloyl-[acyl-carrier protein] methyl ester esterase
MGGQIALEMFRQKSGHKCEHHECKHNAISSLILVSSTPKFVGSDDFPVGMNKSIFSKFRKGIESDATAKLDEFYKLIFADGEDSARFMDGLKQQIPEQKTLMACLNSFEKADERNVLPKIDIPTLIITGDNDKIIDPKVSFFMSQEIKGSELKVFKGAGHAPHLTREEEMIDEISKFLG